MFRSPLHFLDDIKEAASNIRKYTTDMSYDQFLGDRRTQDAVVRNFEIIGEAVRNLPEDLKARHPATPWKRISGFRDIMIHGYHRVDYEIVWNMINTTLPAFSTEIVKILREEERREKQVKR